MACAICVYVVWSLILRVAGARCVIRYFESVQVSLAFTMTSWLCRELRVYIYMAVNPVPYVWEELLSYGSIIKMFPFFLLFKCDFFFVFIL